MPREIRNTAINVRVTPEDKRQLEELARFTKESQTNVIISALNAFAWSLGIGDREKGDSTC